jgi:hypothetical protein
VGEGPHGSAPARGQVTWACKRSVQVVPVMFADQWGHAQQKGPDVKHCAVSVAAPDGWLQVLTWRGVLASQQTIGTLAAAACRQGGAEMVGDAVGESNGG